jgi:ribosome-binding ATPase
MSFTCGIVGLPNVGKSTIFNALTSAKAAAANFPFCTIDPNTGAVPVPDPRLKVLSNLAKSEKIIPAQVTFVDIAGLIKGAAKGEGLGNQFLGHIRSVDAIIHVVRCFTDGDVVHVEGGIDPLRDLDIISTELVLSDYEAIEKAITKVDKFTKSGDKGAIEAVQRLSELKSVLAKGELASTWTYDGLNEHVHQVYSQLLTSKPAMIVANVEDTDCTYEPFKSSGVPVLDSLSEFCKSKSFPLVIISGKIESEIAELPLSERKEYLESLDLESSGLERLATAGYRLLDLVTFFTVGPKETHAWTAPRGSTAPQCAGKIHSDFEKGFIRAEVISYDDYVTTGSEVKAREIGRQRVEGKTYVMVDGDIVHFRFNV